MKEKLLPLLLLFFAFSFTGMAQTNAQQPATSHRVLIGNYLRNAPCGIAWIVDDGAAFVLDTGGPYVRGGPFATGPAAPDDSYHHCPFAVNGANVVFEWGRTGNNVVGRLSSDRQINLNLTLSSGWPGWESAFTGAADGATGVAQAGANQIKWALKMVPSPASTSPTGVTIAIAPDAPVRFVAGLDALPAISSVDSALQNASGAYARRRPQASGAWGDFIGLIADTMNNSRVYANTSDVLCHTVSRGWGHTPNSCPLFCWDSFFTANLAALDDPTTARNTVRAILSFQSPEGMVPNFGMFGEDKPGQMKITVDRSQPPVGSWCVWKMHQRYSDDRDFLQDVYPKLVLWHDWWPKYRNGKHDGLLEWGSTLEGEHRKFQGAQYETGWDDNLTYAPARMVGDTMNCYAVDLSAMWAMDGHYLALIADALGKADDAKRFRKDEADMNRRINEKLWNPDLNNYCSRFWNDALGFQPVSPSAFASGFEGEYFKDDQFQTSLGTAHADTLANRMPGMAGIPVQSKSSRWKGELTAPVTGTYRITVYAQHAAHLALNGKQAFVAQGGKVDTHGQAKEFQFTAGEKVPIVAEFIQEKPANDVRLTVEQLVPMHGAFITRLSPMNFYALSAGAPDAERANLVLKTLTDPGKFWGKYLLPTLAYDDPDWVDQEYWRGDVWAPVDYIAWPGIKKYASPEQIADYADRNVQLFMKNWLKDGVCSENYLSTDGTHAHDPHYTWGALLNLIGLESIVDVDDEERIVLNGAQIKTISLKNIPLLGRRYDVKTSPGSAVLVHDGKIVLEAKGEFVRAKLDDLK